MDLVKKLLFRPTELLSQVSAAIHSPSTPRIILHRNSATAVTAGTQIKGILFVKSPPSQLKSAQVTLNGSAKTHGFVNRIQADNLSSSSPSDAFHNSYSRTNHLAASYHPIVNDTRTLHPGRRLISPQSRFPRTLGPGRRPKPIISSPTFRFPFAIQVPQDAPSTHDDSANSAPSSIRYSLTARVTHPLPKLPSSHSLPITVYEPPLPMGGQEPSTVTTTQATWSLFDPGQIAVTVTCPTPHLLITNTQQALTLTIKIDNKSPRKCLAVVATLSRRDACLVKHEYREFRAEHVAALADAEVPLNVPAHAQGREVRVVIPGIETGGWTPSTTGGYDKVRIGYFVRVKVQLDVGVGVEVDQMPIDVRVGHEMVACEGTEQGRIRLKVR